MENGNKHPINRTILAGITLGVIGLIFYLALQIFKPFLGIIVTACIFTIFLNPVYKKLKLLTGKGKLSAFLTVLLTFIFMVLPFGLLLSSLLAEVVDVSKSIQANPEWILLFQSMIDNQLNLWQIPVRVIDVNLDEQIYQGLSFLARNLGGVLLRSGGVILNLFFALMTIYFLLINQKKIYTYIESLRLFPKKHTKFIAARIVEVVNGTVRGYLLVVVLQLIVGVLAFLYFRIPAAILLGSLYGLSSLLPVVGGFLLWVPVVIWQVASGNISVAIILTLWFLLLSFLVENILTPKIIGKSTKLHQLFVMFSVFGGIQYFGLMGMVLGPVIIALFFVALVILKEFVANDHDASDEILKSLDK